MKKLLRTAAAAACLCLLAACAPARQAGGGEPGAPREDFTSVPSGMQAGFFNKINSINLLIY